VECVVASRAPKSYSKQRADLQLVNMNLARIGIEFVMEFEKKQGREPLDVSRQRRFVGFDVISVDKHGTDHRTIEVKTTEHRGIPDAFENEFTRQLRFVATHLYVVYVKGETKRLHIIRKKEIDKFADKHISTQHIRFASALMTKMKKGEFEVKV